VNDRPKNQLEAWEETCTSVLALYLALKDSHLIRVKRAEIKQGGVPAEPIDFCADVAMRLATFPQTAVDALLVDPENEKLSRARMLFGRVFEESRLGPTGDYAALYFKIKNQSDRKKVVPQEETNAADAGEAVSN
jgi:hypothetical protein